MPLPNLDKLTLYTPIPALQNSASGSFTITVSGVLAPSTPTNYRGSTTFSRKNSVVRLYLSQNVTPVDAFTDYSAGALLPSPPYGSQSDSPLLNVKCSVTGSPSVTSIAVSVSTQFTVNNLTTTISINNPFAGNMTLTTTVFTVRYISFLPSQAFAPN